MTPYAYEASWLFFRLRDMFACLIDYCTKIEFYGRLARAITRYHGKVRGMGESAEGLAAAVLDEAALMLAEMKEGRFRYLSLAPGGMIADDLEERE